MVDTIRRNPTLGQQVYDLLKEQIHESTPGAFILSERELAESLSVSRKTVRRAIKQLQEEGYIHSQQGRGTFVTDKIRTKFAEVLYFHLPFKESDDNYIYARCWRAMKRTVEQAGHRIDLVANPVPKGSHGPSYDLIGKNDKPDLIATLGIMNPNYISGLFKYDVPVITVDYDAAGFDADGVVFDSFGAGRMMTAHLIRLGHRRIAYVGAHRGQSVQGWYRPEPDSVRIRAGYEYTLQELGLKRDERYIAEETMNDVDGAVKVARRMLSLPDRPTAFISFSNRHIEAIIETAAEMGLSCPDDISVITYGEIDPNYPIDITHIQADMDRLGVAAGQKIVSRLMEETRTLHQIVSIPTLLIPGESVKAPKNTNGIKVQ